MAREYVTVTLTARLRGDRLVLLDSHGKIVRTIAASRCVVVPDDRLRRMEAVYEWSNAISGMLASYDNHASRFRGSSWEKKCSTWIKSLRLRANRKRPPRTPGKRRRRHVAFSSWERAADRLVKNHASWKLKAEYRKRNPWLLWAETVDGNLRKKRGWAGGATQVCDESKPGRKGRVAGVQMRFDWRGTDARPVVA